MKFVYIWFVKCWNCNKYVLSYISKGIGTSEIDIQHDYIFHNASKCKEIKGMKTSEEKQDENTK